ncbi:glycerophosphodiester phosphodiesterase [Streptomyces aidingensis]|uniref:Glycerophosphoryl diester phosphodiesterase n=1 Tax=Streptomyces aidingensis TaxID=910347 RepID=A0A1I1NUT0_9ACTN|nr:glycerophosphodiester phosphodiesterase [Streptomyces aidingensis]SFD01421.1 glycerophosphoryl diester phosphodiesterase [Streptomyces aidingensis]
MTLVIAHRGDPYRARENTLPSIRSALAAGADVVELDVRLTRDGVPVVLHDPTLKRLWGHDLAVARLTAEEVRELTGGGVPTLREALETTFPARTLIDLPEPSAQDARAVVAEVAAEGSARRVYWCGDPAAVRGVRRADPEAEISLTWKRAAPVRESLLRDVRPAWLNHRWSLLDERTVRRAREGGYQVCAWTADTTRAMRRLLELGVDAVHTNRPAVLRTEITRARERNRPPAAG